ncbi:hypothetical protein MBELCI_3037 [Limimaricola cinnabarinus LL-001]|uniref:Uncharacterized protein n=1 Tax=Limimaricola cinnabarinus LL-001 TaxID=1337093 RepID=U2Z6D9_9RHOB|nr:hypothetical protein MBELCI_3037 [Limimaricola cinnabarinus LL-001]
MNTGETVEGPVAAIVSSVLLRMAARRERQGRAQAFAGGPEAARRAA